MVISNLNIEYGNKILFRDFNIEFMDNKINCILGESGIGKTTLLNNISDSLLKNNIKFSYVFQEDRLIEWLSVYDNLKLIANKFKIKQVIDKKILEALDIVNLIGCESLFPAQLSGGMRQRVNIARAIIRDDSIILMDEPFKSIDDSCKFKIMNYIKGLSKKTIIIVTHNREEAEFLNAEVYLLQGKPIKYAEKVDIKKNINKF